MKRVSLASISEDDQIEIILAHPMAGKYIAALIEDSANSGVLTSYAVVYEDETVCLRVPVHVSEQTETSHLLVWHSDTRNPWRVESRLLPRDSSELRLLALAVSTVSPRARPRLPSSRAA